MTAKFFARSPGSGTWNYLNGTTVAATSGQVARATLPALSAGSTVEWTVRTCDATQCSASSPTKMSVVSGLLGAGGRKSATPLPFQLGDRVQGQVDVGTGNLLVVAEGLAAPGVSGDVSVGMAYNSLALVGLASQAVTTNPAGFGWTQTVGLGVRVESQADGSVIYWGPAGLSGTFAPSGTAGVFVPAAGFTADLAQIAGGWTLTDHASAQKQTFNAAGLLTSITDRNGNVTTITYNPYAATVPLTVTGNAGPVAARAVNVVRNGSTGRISGINQSGTGSVSRAVAYGYDGAGDLVTVKDALNRTTTFTYAAHELITVTAPGGITTNFTYDAQARVTSVRQVNTTAGSPGETWTRFAYPSPTQVLVSDGAQEQAGSPATGPHTTYTLTTEQRVTTAVDAAGRTRSAQYTPNIDPASTTQGTGPTGATTSMTYGANNGESLMQVAAPTGATRGWAYANTASGTKHLPSSSTDSSGNQSLYTYNGAGNPITATSALAAQASLTRNTDGTVATATGPGNAPNATGYTYTNAQVTQVTPVTGSSLGVRNFTYDPYGRLATETNGRGITTTYTYDVLDRVTGIDYSGTTPNPDVSYTYDSAGRLATRTDPAGTTTSTYDQVSNLLTRVNTFDNKTITYGYDKGARLARVTDGRGYTTYAYDTAGALTAMEYNQGAGRATTRFAVDEKGRRTDTWMQTNDTNTIWAAHSHTDYDASGRPSRIIGERNAPSSGGGAPTVEVDLTYCYAAGSTHPTCSTTPTDDRSFVQWRANNLTGQVTTYTYNTATHLTGAAMTAGTKADGTPLPAVTYAYTYDARGNRTTASSTTGGVTTTQTRTHNPANQLTTPGFTYDGAGNLTADPTAGTVTYSAGDQMATVTRNGATYDYTYAGTGNNELLRHEVGASTYAYTYGREAANGRPVIEQVHLGTTQSAYLDNDPTGQPIQLRTSTGQALLYIYDGLGSPAALLTSFDTSAFQYSFDPYGVATLEQSSGGNGVAQTPFLYTGGLHDRTTGWIKNGARYYTPGEGRWTQRDTLDAPLDPNNANRYAYAGCNPVNYVDPRGQATCGEALFFGAVGLIGLAASGFALVTMGAGTPVAAAVWTVVGFQASAMGGLYGVATAARECW